VVLDVPSTAGAVSGRGSTTKFGYQSLCTLAFGTIRAFGSGLDMETRHQL